MWHPKNGSSEESVTTPFRLCVQSTLFKPGRREKALAWR